MVLKIPLIWSFKNVMHKITVKSSLILETPLVSGHILYSQLVSEAIVVLVKYVQFCEVVSPHDNETN